MKKLVSVAVVLSLGLTGCASILNENTQKVNVSSSTGKDIKGSVDGVSFAAPGVVSVTRTNKDKVFITDTEGCAKETVVEKTVDPKFFINILSGGAFGSTTDYASDKMWKYSENVVISCKQ